MPEIELFTSNLSPYAHRVRLALLEKKIDFWHTEIDLANKPEWFLVIAPLGEVPVICHEDRFIADSTVILEYLEEVYPNPPLRPKDAAKRAIARFSLAEICRRALRSRDRPLPDGGDGRRAGRFRSRAARSPLVHGTGRTSALRPWTLLDGSRAQHRGSCLLPVLRAISRHSAISAGQPAVDFIRLRYWLDAMRERASVKATQNPVDFYARVFGAENVRSRRRFGNVEYLHA